VVRRVKGGKLRKSGDVIGIAGLIRNVKNKAGEGSVESREAGFKILWNRPLAKVSFMSRTDVDDMMTIEKKA
jgi:hypothetical protein